MTLRLTKPVRPPGLDISGDSKDQFYNHPSFCSVCATFDIDAALWLQGLSSNVVVSYDIDHPTAQVRAMKSEIYDAASKGCGSCSVLRWAITETVIDSQSEIGDDWQATIVFRKDLALSVSIRNMVPSAVSDGEFDPWNFQVGEDARFDIGEGDRVMLEIYTLRGSRPFAPFDHTDRY